MQTSTHFLQRMVATWLTALIVGTTCCAVQQTDSLATDSLRLTAHGGQVAVGTNLLYDATLTPNLSLQVQLSPRWTLGVTAGLNAWDIDAKTNKKWRHLLVAPTLRRWLSADSTARHRDFVAANLVYSHFNIGNTRIPFGLYQGVKDRRLQGDLIGLGADYGYSWIMARRWRIEAEAGVAVGYAWFREYDCAHCGTYYGRGDRIFLLPQLGVNVVYIIN